MAKYAMEMVLEYAKVFEENRDMGNDKNDTGRKIAKHNGQCVTNAYFTDEDQIKKLVKEGLKEVNLGHPRIKEGDSSFGIGKYMKIGRFFEDVKTFTDNKGNLKEVDYGGKPTVVNLTKGIENKSLWSFEEDGELGNGTKAMVQFETYLNGSGVRLLAVAVTEHVPFEENFSAEDEMFTV